MRALLDPDGPDPATADGLHERYRPPRDRWVRASFVSAADGAASVEGTSGALGGDADHAVFEVVRDHADIVLVGAGTVRAEGYGSPDPSADRRARRVADGRAEVPRLAVVGRPARLTGHEKWITGATATPYVVTAERDAHEVPGCELLVAGTTQVDLAAALTRLADRGLTSVLCEGGPSLFGSLSGAGLLDELCLTYAPVLGGPGAGRIVAGDTWPAPRGARLAGLLEEDGVLLARYLL